MQKSPARPSAPEGPLHLPPHLAPGPWRQACRGLAAKMIAEFSYEELFAPQPLAPGTPAASPGTPAAPPGAPALPYRLALPGGDYRFTARRGAYGSWRVDPESVTAPDGADPDPVRLLHAARHALGISGDTAGHLVRELTATLTADAHHAAHPLTAARLADLDHADLEGRQTGHPWIVPSKGRLGFSAADTARWAPESRNPQRLPWIAVHTRLAAYRGTAGLDTPDRLYDAELDPDVREAFRRALLARGADPDDHLLLPVHPWQWDETVVPLFAPSIAAGDIIPLTTDNDLRLPQQSIRTFLNASRPDRHHVKLPLSILNTLVWRGLPTERTLAAPAVTAWVHSLRDRDPFLRDECRVVLLGEVASVTVEHPVYGDLPEAPYQYKELLGAIWREPLTRHLAPGERARTLAALLQTGCDGRPLTAELVARSGLAARDWLRRLFAVMLPPLLHFLYRYGTVFSPHGENAVVLFDERDVPVRLAVKDFVDDVNVSDRPLPELADMPADVAAVLLRERPDFLCQFIHSGLFVGVYRYLAPLVEAHLGVPEEEFWGMVREEVLAYQRRFPGAADRFALFDLLTPRIERLCLNRNRLLLDGYRDRPQRPHAAVHGTVPNPLHRPAPPAPHLSARPAAPARSAGGRPAVGGAP
ncbi:IucA/IucC family siderophore biosynthesis protein [Streptacidiphilus sp. ASG 303]|uniref:IucA/IucC family protein n=1 Tax=Streptacidiphilus sp. ASG 303 TaxID=2896847 RepID=UPI001E4609A4|nr:IucA/IucC family siderophore biosynthesis protein [Streptacidiphilus sp. ASG 303]MCD0484669.1 IucA/IucC family siderophore biosynthesis protein [Streptacidiphilus sp. ASG 303]